MLLTLNHRKKTNKLMAKSIKKSITNSDILSHLNIKTETDHDIYPALSLLHNIP